jgi:colanic acid biosynthesis glycosyl transferase WcaI
VRLAMRILYLTQSFPPEPGATARPLKQAASLRRLGHNVTIITSMPFYPYGRIYPEYRWRLFRRETMEGVRVLRIWSFPSPNRGVGRRLISFGTFATLAVLAGLLQPRPNLIIASVPNPGTDLAGIIVARLKSASCVVEFRDLIPVSLPMIGHSPDGVLVRIASAYTGMVGRLADVIAVPGTSMIDLLCCLGVRPDRVLLLPHAADPTQGASSPTVEAIREKHGLRGWFVGLYAGNLSHYNGLDTLLEATRILRRLEARIKLVLLGAGTERARLEGIVREQKLDTLVVAGPVPPDDVPPYLQAADLLISSHRMTPYECGLYTKECEYLLAGRPIVAVENRPRLKLILDSIDAGVGVRHDDAAGLAEALQWHANHPEDAARRGRNAREYAERHLLRDDVVRTFVEELNRRLGISAKGGASAI